MSINLTNLTDDLNIIQSLNDTPTESASELKAKFDESGNKIKTFLNGTLIQEIQTAFNTIKSEAILAAHPVGSYYWSSSNTSPATLFGGTWIQVTDKFILAAGSTYTAGATGGSATHNHTQASTTGSTTLTTNQIPAHTHGSKSLISGKLWLKYAPQIEGTNTGILKVTEYQSSGVAGVQKEATTGAGYQSFEVDATHEHNSVGGGQGHTHTLGSTNSSSNMPPYEVAYCWKRTA